MYIYACIMWESEQGT